MKTKALAIELLQSVPSAYRKQWEDTVIIGDGEWQELPTDPPPLGPIRDNAARIAKELDNALKENNWQPTRLPSVALDAGAWSLGSVDQRASARKIHRGYLEPVRRFTILEGVPDLVVAFLARIPGWDDFVKRENHPGVGWHYHYLVDRTKRSDALLAWDTRWQSPPDKPSTRHPLFGEKHGEGKADVHAKPWLWGAKKKQSMYELCSPDLKRWPIHEFRCASSHADPVWPTTGSVTPMPSPAAKSDEAPHKTKRR
ncbi:hypothetical protein GB927_022000 [Shinella sp. CPCC 100929]|uniref:Uncharacterized protein n=1 Tax=Shinella lacus TaxID=2654216 RepID=A0ABT1RC16_9HYPH|nr:hypothetical protein [Shinella lacus]MCQ4632731.1 hypothetical protein [Shinella lacus]